MLRFTQLVGAYNLNKGRKTQVCIKINTAQKKDITQPNIKLGSGNQQKKSSDEESEKSLELMESEDTGPTKSYKKSNKGDLGELSKGMFSGKSDLFSDDMIPKSFAARQRAATQMVVMNYKPSNDGAKPDVHHYNLEAMRNQNPAVLMDLAVDHLEKERLSFAKGLSNFLNSRKEEEKKTETESSSSKIVQAPKAGKLVSDSHSKPKVQFQSSDDNDVEAVDSDEMN